MIPPRTHCSLVAFAAVALAAAAPAQQPAPFPLPVLPRGQTETGAMQKAFIAVAEHLRPPAATPRMSYGSLFDAYETGFLAAAAALSAFQIQLNDVASTPGADPTLAAAVGAAVGSISLGFQGISSDLSDATISSALSFWTAADGYAQLAILLPQVHSEFADAGAAAQDASDALTAIVATMTIPVADPFEPFFTSFFALRETQKAIAEGLLPDMDPPAGLAATAPCPAGSYRGCTNYTTTTYGNVSCGAWGRVIGGIDISVGAQGQGGGSISVGTSICPDGGLWKRTCTMDACVTQKCVCQCYESKWDRFWASNGFNKTVVVSDLGCTSESFSEYEWECTGPPPAAPPAAPSRDLSLGDSQNC